MPIDVPKFEWVSIGQMAVGGESAYAGPPADLRSPNSKDQKPAVGPAEAGRRQAPRRRADVTCPSRPHCLLTKCATRTQMKADRLKGVWKLHRR